jgi:hypothetical protein
LFYIVTLYVILNLKALAADGRCLINLVRIVTRLDYRCSIPLD